jgi:hypothetical protein
MEDVVVIDDGQSGETPEQSTKSWRTKLAAKGTMPSENFNRALLTVWLGAQPADGGLKKAMLGG